MIHYPNWLRFDQLIQDLGSDMGGSRVGTGGGGSNGKAQMAIGFWYESPSIDSQKRSVRPSLKYVDDYNKNVVSD